MIISSRYPKLVDVREVALLHDFTVRVTFSDETQREIDLAPYLRGPIFEPIRTSPEIFGQLRIDNGALAWPNGADIDTDTLDYNGPPPRAEAEIKARAKTKTRGRKRVKGRAHPARGHARVRG